MCTLLYLKDAHEAIQTCVTIQIISLNSQLLLSNLIMGFYYLALDLMF